MPLTNHPISPKNKKIKNNPQIEKIAEALGDSGQPERKPVETEKLQTTNRANAEPQSSPSSFVSVGGSLADKEKIDSRKEFFRLMAEKIKDKDFNINKAMAVKEEINRMEKGAKLEESSAREDVREVEETEEVEDGGEDNYNINQELIEEDYNIEDNEQLTAEKSPKKLKTIALYKKIVYRFLFLTVILLIVVSYFSFVRLDMIIYPEKNNIDGSLNFYAYSNGEQINLDRAIKSSITKVEIEEKDVFRSSGEKDSGGEIVGRVKIINNYSKNQPLVATTRLLSSGDKLFRIKDTVNVPAGGSVEVDIYADSVSEEMAIDPDKFIIPGLWLGVQDKIYAESYDKFEFRKDSKKYIMEKDVDDAIELLNDKIVEQAELKAKAAIGAGRRYVLSIDHNSSVINTNKEIGEESEDFEVSVKNVVSIISFETNDIINLAKQKISIETSQDISEIDANSLNFELVNFDSAKNLAEVKALFAARASVGSDDFINKKHLSNLSKEQVEAYLNNIKEIKSYELIFTPSFIERSPLLVDKINIEYR